MLLQAPDLRNNRSGESGQPQYTTCVMAVGERTGQEKMGD